MPSNVAHPSRIATPIAPARGNFPSAVALSLGLTLISCPPQLSTPDWHRTKDGGRLAVAATVDLAEILKSVP